MFITVTRREGGRALRLATAAITYLDRLENGTAIRLIGSDTSLMVAETIEEIEERALPPIAAAAELCVVERPSLEEIVTAVGAAWREQFPARPAVDVTLELAAIGAAEAAGLTSAAHAAEERIDVVKRRRGGAR